MGLFTTTKKKTKKTAAVKSTPVNDGRLEGVLKAPWMSEKALISTESGVYVFQVPPEATKTQIAAAIEMIYKVKPRKVNIVNMPGKPKPMRNKRGVGYRARRHKAYVYLKKGETITLA